jgi:hypothetical protein
MGRKVVLFAVVMVLALGISGCGKTETPAKAPGAGDMGPQAAQAAAQATVDDLEAKWVALVDKAAPTTDEAKADLQKAADDMAQVLADAKAKLEEAKAASADQWQKTIKPALDDAIAKAQKLYADASVKFGAK